MVKLLLTFHVSLPTGPQQSTLEIPHFPISSLYAPPQQTQSSHHPFKLRAMGNADFECPHRVAIPPTKPFLESLSSNLKETFFPDDPFKQFKNQPLGPQILLWLKYFIPIFEWAPHYTLDFFKSDLVSGVTIASLAVPQGISYASLASIPPIIGLCNTPFSDTMLATLLLLLSSSSSLHFHKPMQIRALFLR